MAYKFTYSKNFIKSFNKLNEKEKRQTKEKIKLLVKDSSHLSLRVKKIQGTDNFYEASVNMDIRLIWYYEGDEYIFFLDVGHHDILKKY